MTKRKDPFVKALDKAWRRLRERRESEVERLHSKLRAAQRQYRTQLARFISEIRSRAETKALLLELEPEIGVRERRQRRDLDDAIRAERKRQAEGDSEQRMLSIDEARELGLVPHQQLTLPQLIKELSSGNVDILRSDSAITVMQELQRTGNARDAERVGKAIAQVRRGPRKTAGKGDDGWDRAAMRQLKSDVQRRLTGVRRAMKRTGNTDPDAYVRALKHDVLAPLMLRSDQHLKAISDPNLKPIEAAIRVVCRNFRAPRELVKRLGRAPAKSPQSPPKRGRPQKREVSVQLGESERKRRQRRRAEYVT